MANNSNVDYKDYKNNTSRYSFLVDNNANVDANYGPWISTDAYEAWLQRTDIAGAGATPIEGTLIAVKPTNSSDVTLYVYSNGTWKLVGSGGTGADDIGYVDHNVDVDILEKKVVSTSANQGLDPTQQDNARKNIGAVATDVVVSKGSYLCTINNTRISQGDEVTLQGIDSGGSSQPSISTRSDVVSNSTALVESSGIYTFVTNQLASKADAEALAEKADKTELSGKADKGSTLSEYGINDAYTKTETFEAITNALGDYVKKNNAQVTGDLSVNGSTTLGNEDTDTITLNGTVNSNVVIGKTDSAANNKNLTVNGNLTLGTLTANSILKLDNNKKVVSDTGYYMKFGGELDSYDDLPDSSVEVGDTRYIRDKDEFVVASSVTNDNNLYIRVPGVNLITLNVEGTDPTHPIVSYSDLKSNLTYVHTTYSDYPLIDYYYHSLPAGSDGKLRVIPVNGGDYGTIVVLASTQKIFVVTTQDDGGPVNSWYCTGLDNTGEVKDITSSLPENDITIRTFTVFGGGVVWTGTKDYTEDNTIKFAPQTLTEAQKARARLNIGALGADNINSIFNATYYAAGFNSPEKTELDDNLAFEKIDSLLNAGIVPTLCVLEDGISCYYTYWKYIPTGSALDEWGIAGTEKDYHAFSTWKYEDGSLKFKVQLCESGSLNLTTKYIPDATQS